MTEAAIIFNDVNKDYGRQKVLSDVNLRVYQGEAVGLIGVNGAGKTTLIKCLLDFVALTSGDIKLFGTPHLNTDARGSLSFLPEKFLPPYYLAGEKFLTYMAELNQIEISPADMKRVCDSVDLDVSALQKPVRQYSKGMAQKLGLASCFLSQRPMLILDEPMSGLDPKARAYLKRHLISLKDAGKTLFFSTHLLADVESICDRIIILHEGSVNFNGTPEDCCEEFKAHSLEEAYLKCIGA
ncbi:MAG: ABC-2 type transport system ATP-binding protein [Gammaproteobacteria bacterium]|jgi:ABC-2 type transport system ATP-binding protein